MNFKLSKAEPDKQLRQELEAWKLEDLIKKLESISPGASANTPVDTKRRVIRAIEVTKSRGREKRDRKKETGKRRPENSTFPYTTVIGIEYPREVIRQQITKRLYSRLNNGMIEEVEALLIGGVTHHRLDTLGLEYRFISRFLKGDYSKDEMTGLLNTAIHQFAKKQMTFFRNMEKNGIKIHWIPEGDFETMLEAISKG